MARDRGRFTDEFRDSVAREVVEQSRAMVDVAKRHGVSVNSVSRWVKSYRGRYPETVVEESLSISERDRLRELEKEVRVLREENEILGKATAYVGDRCPSGVHPVCRTS